MTFTPPNAQYPRLFQDHFNRVNQSPLDRSLWNVVGGGLSGNPPTDQLAYLAFRCATTIQYQGDGQASVNGVVFPPEQWSEAKVSTLNANGVLFMYLRADEATLGPSYALAIVGPMNAATFTIYQIDPTGGEVVYTWADNLPFTFTDRITFTCEGGKLTFYADGVQKFQGNLSDSPVLIEGGVPGIQLATLSVPLLRTDVELSNFQAGSSTL